MGESGNAEQKMGKVWLVGAGPGDAGLFTRKGAAVLAQADVVVYDALVGDGVLALVPHDVRTIDVGKRAANHTMPQEQISQVLLDEALAGNNVVRLKGGDPFMFGRGGEELELLSAHGVPFEVVPGITSALAVPAYNGIPVTHRDFTSSLHIITGHKRAGAEYDIDFEALVRTRGTLVFLMGVRALPDLMAGLLNAGMDPEMPAAVLQEGTTAGQRRVVATVSTLAQKAAEAQVKAPAIIVVGGVASLAEQFAWYEKLPLAGCKVVVTRPAELVSTMSARLRTLGAEVLDVPAIATVPVEGDQESGVLSAARIAEYDWVVLTSPSGVRIFFDRLQAEGVDVRALTSVRFAALGSGTAKELRRHGINADFMPSAAYGETLGRELAEVAEPGSKILIPRARIGNAQLVRALEDAGHSVDDVATYDTVPLKGGLVDVEGEIASGRVFCVAFTSSSGVRAFVEAHPEMDFNQVRAACIGKLTCETAQKAGMRTCMSDEPSIGSLVDLIIREFAEAR